RRPKQYLPRGPEELVDQALSASQRAFADGVKRQRIELLLPLIGATDLDDWPGGIRQQFKAGQPMVESLLRSLKKDEALQGPLSARILDQGDAVGAWTSPRLAAILFPTPETLKQACTCGQMPCDTLMINPQWQPGNLVNDFGIGPWRRRSEDFVASFEEVYILKQMRIAGDNVRLLRTYPGGWQVYLAPEGQAPELITVLDTRPSYKELEDLLRATEGSNAGKTWVERIKGEFAFNKDSLDRK
ncbi:hypothetical protein COCSUDRAFT_13233, partial [Coccomyxa subellipsoidea C-169]